MTGIEAFAAAVAVAITLFLVSGWISGGAK
jgi:hypothetical protein